MARASFASKHTHTHTSLVRRHRSHNQSDSERKKNAIAGKNVRTEHSLRLPLRHRQALCPKIPWYCNTQTHTHRIASHNNGNHSLADRAMIAHAQLHLRSDVNTCPPPPLAAQSCVHVGVPGCPRARRRVCVCVHLHAIFAINYYLQIYAQCVCVCVCFQMQLLGYTICVIIRERECASRGHAPAIDRQSVSCCLNNACVECEPLHCI